ncbi:MAG TPA: sigma-54 dependent transcriptional regulator [Terriglobia bacterium]|nr:sigma-54 dependent transcriptional regulator [Terriglobia bacterium]
MHDEIVRTMFYSADPGFSELITRALGPDFLVRSCNLHDFSNVRNDGHECDVILVDLSEVGNSSAITRGLCLMETFKQTVPHIPIIAIVAYGDDDLARLLTGKGVFDTLASPPATAELRQLLRRAHRAHQSELELSLLRSPPLPPGRFGDLIGFTNVMAQTFDLARKLATCDVSVLITGETGTGKELLARAIHDLSPRCSGPFVGFSCANLPETLIEDELFGHEKGAFTGAVALRQGRFEQAEGGTLFFDEIGDLALGLQAKLLRVLQERTFERLGGDASITTNVRVICATHRQLESLSLQGGFRADLYYRLNVVEIHLPALWERREDIPLLAHHFLSYYGEQFQKELKGFSPVAMRALEEFSWPGNVRELENAVQRAVVMAEGATVELWHLPKNLCDAFDPATPGRSYEEAVRDFKRRLILRTFRECGGRKTEVARTLGVTRSYLHRLMNQLQIPRTELADGLPDPESSTERLM